MAEPSITRLYRAAIRIGEDFITIEETITLPADADDEAVQQAVDLGWRIYAAQREAVAQQAEQIRQARQTTPTAPASSSNGSGTGYADPFGFSGASDMPASEKQRNYIGALQDKLGWSSEELSVFAAGRNIDLVSMTKPEASAMIEEMKRLADARKAAAGSRSVEPPAVPMFADRPELNPVSDDDLPF